MKIIEVYKIYRGGFFFLLLTILWRYFIVVVLWVIEKIEKCV